MPRIRAVRQIVAALGLVTFPALGADLDGEQLYRKHCLVCHQEDGGGVPGFQPELIAAPWVTGGPEGLAVFVLAGSLAMGPSGDWDNTMPGFSGLPDADLAALLTYVRREFGAGAGPVTPKDVAQARQDLPEP